MDDNSTDVLIKVRNLKVVYDKGLPSETTAVRDASFDIFKEDFIVIFGPSGCGKSTLLYAMAGIERRIEAGKILIKDHELVSMTKKELTALHRKEIGIIFQAYNLIPTLNVLGNVALPLLASGVEKKKREKKAHELLDRFEVGQFFKRFPQYMSGGQQQRVAIARALINDPDIIFADEPTGNLDSVSAEIVMKALLKLNGEDKKTIVLVTHDPSYIAYAHRVIYMKDGMVVREEIRKKKYKYEKKVVGLRGGEKEGKKDGEKEEDKKTPILLPAKCSIKRPVFNTVSLARYFDWHFTPEEERRLEQILQDRTDGKIKRKVLLERLDAPFKEGGMGFYQQKALRLTNEIEEILKLSTSLQQYMKEGKDMEKKVVHISEWLLSDYGGKVTPNQQKSVERGILSRINGEYSRVQFQAYLDIPLVEGGAGFVWQTARNLARKMETILMQ